MNLKESGIYFKILSKKKISMGFILKFILKSKKLFSMLTNGLCCAGTDLLIRCLQPGVECVVWGKSSDTSH